MLIHFVTPSFIVAFERFFIQSGYEVKTLILFYKNGYIF